jgi:restriction endonuclease S subunit
MLSPKFVDIINMSTYGAKMPRANWNFIGSVKAPFPTIEEQEEIADSLDRHCTRIDDLIAEKRELIEKLELYKRSLIYETVTGKRKVV